MQPSTLPPRFTDVAFLGEGAFGRVYRAQDDQGRPVAVKTLAAEMAKRPEAAWQFAGEYRKLARLAHPAFPRAYEEGRTLEGLPFYTMEFVAGAPLTGPMPAAQVEEALLAIAAALAYLHGLGYVHGDLKPENVLKGADGRYVVLDVGLMTPTGARREAVAGTLEYLAPEAFKKAPVDPAADLYALGCLAYALWTGRPPFTGAPTELVRGHLLTPPPPLAGRSADADADLEELVAALLQKDPTARPASALMVLSMLGEPVDDARLRAAGHGLKGAAFVGREAVLTAWEATLAAGGTLAFGGDAGLGKSRTLDALRVAAQLAAKPWVGAAATGAADAPGAPWRAIVRQTLAESRLAPSALTTAWLEGTVPEALRDLEPPARKAMVQLAVVEDLLAASRTLNGLAIGLDDWHLADSASQDLLGLLKRTAADAPVAIAVAQAPPAHGVSAAQAEAAPADFHRLPPLSEPEAIALLESRLGGPLPPGLAEGLLPAAQGSPLLLELLLEHMVGTGRLMRDAEGWAFDTAGTTAGLPSSLGAVWEARYRHLDAEARRLAAVAAVAIGAGELPVPLLTQVAGAAEAAVETLLAEGVLTGREGQVRLAMGAMAEVFLAGVADSERRNWAEALARALLGEGQGRGLPLDTLSRAAGLALASGNDALAAEVAGEAGRRSLAMGAPTEARRLLAAALERLSERAEAGARLALVLPLAEALRQLNQPAAAIAAYEEALPLAETVGATGRAALALVGLAKCRQLSGDSPGALEALERAERAAVAAGDLTQQAAAAAYQARVRLFSGQAREAIACCERAEALARQAGSVPIRIQALNLHGALLVQEDPGRAEEAFTLLNEALRLSEELGDRPHMGLALENLGNARLALGHLVEAEDAFRRQGELYRAIGNETEAVSADFNRALAASERGDVATALPLAEDVVRRAVAAGRKFPVVVAKTAVAQASWRLGRPAEARAAADAALEVAVGLKNKLLEEHARLYRLETLVALGDLEAAAAEAELLGAIVAETHHAEAEARLGCHRAELLRLAGDFARALEAADAWTESPNRAVAHRALQIRAHAALASDPVLAEAEATAALAIAEDWQSAWHVAADRWLLAEAHARAGRADAAAWEARQVLEGPGENLYARAGAALVLAEQGEVASAVAALRPGGAGLSEPERTAWLQAQDLASLDSHWNDQPAPVAPASEGEFVIDPIMYAAYADALSLETEETAIGQAALAGAMGLVGAERGYLLSYEGGRLRQAITQNLSYTAEVEQGFSHSIAEQVLFSSQPLYVANASADSQWKEAASVMALELKTVVCLPLAVPSQILGVLYMDRQAIEPVLTNADLSLLTTFATFAASAIMRERARIAAEQEAVRERTCAALGARLAHQAGEAEVRRETLLAAIAACGAERGFWLRAVHEVSAATAGGEGFASLVGAERAGKALAYDPAQISQSVARWVLERQEGMSLLDMGDAEGWQAGQSVMALGLRTVWCLPAGECELLYLDTTEVVEGDPNGSLRTLEALVDYGRGILR